MDIQNLNEFSLMFLSGLVVIFLLAIVVCTEVSLLVVPPHLRRAFLLHNLLRVQSTEYNLTSDYDPHISHLTTYHRIIES